MPEEAVMTKMHNPLDDLTPAVLTRAALDTCDIIDELTAVELTENDDFGDHMELIAQAADDLARFTRALIRRRAIG
jgi:hypothetical protein